MGISKILATQADKQLPGAYGKRFSPNVVMSTGVTCLLVLESTLDKRFRVRASRRVRERTASMPEHDR